MGNTQISVSYNNNEREEEQRRRRLEVYAVYNLDKFAVRFITGTTNELEGAITAAKAASSSQKDDQPKLVKKGSWLLVSETGGLSSSVSYPLRSLTQDFLYIGFQNLVDAWIEELNENNNNNRRKLQSDGEFDFGETTTSSSTNSAAQDDQSRVVEVFQNQGGDATGEEDNGNSVTVGTQTATNIHNGDTPQEDKAQTAPPVSEPARDSGIISEDEQNYNIPPGFVDVYDGLVHHSMYDHIVTIDLRVKLYIRTDGNVDNDLGKRNLRSLQGATELVAEITPTIEFAEPVSQADIATKPSNEDVRQVFGGWMTYLFGSQKDIYLKTLKEHPTQALLQDISKLAVDVKRMTGGAPPTLSTTTNPRKPSYKEDWSERTKNALVTMLVVLAVVAVVWPLYAWRQHAKRNEELRLQILHAGGLSLSGDRFGDEYSTNSDGFSSIRYRDDPSVASSNSSSQGKLARPPALSLSARSYSLDNARHGADVYPTAARKASPSTASAMNALEASDRYLSRHRPDLFYDQHRADTNNSISVFGRVYEIPSNPFEFIYKQQQEQQVASPPKHLSPSSGLDLGRSAHFPFSSPSRSTFTGRSVSMGSAGATATTVNSHFTPIQNLNLAAGGEADDDETQRIAAAAGFATGHSWQHDREDAPDDELQSSGSLVGTIFRNLSMSSWYNSNNSNAQTNHVDPDTNPTFSGAEEEIYYDDDYPRQQQHNNPQGFAREIEMETLPHDLNLDEDTSNYNFAFQDFPRKDGTPCLIIDDDTFLSERKRRESAKMIFTIDDNDNYNNELDDSFSEKKFEDDSPVCNDTFKRILSRNSLAIDGSSFVQNSLEKDDDEDDLIVIPPLEGSFLSEEDDHDVKSPEFQQKLSRLMETKQKRYTQEKKNEAIVAAGRKKRKSAREKERVDRHKAIERELEDIEAEFSMTVQPRSPTHTNSPPKNALSPSSYSPKPTSYSPMPPPPPRFVASPARNTIAAHSPGRALRGRNGHVRNNSFGGGHSLGGSHRRQQLLGASPFRKASPRHPHQSQSIGDAGELFRGGSVSPPPPGLADFDGDVDYKPRFRPVNLYGSERISQQHQHANQNNGPARYDDLALPSMNFHDAKYPSPQAVIDEVMQTDSSSTSASSSMHKPSRSFGRGPHRQRSRTPTRASARLQQQQQQQQSIHRRVNSFDVDESFERNSHRRTRSVSISDGSNNNVNCNSNHKRTNSVSGDVFLHGVVAQTRFV